MTQANVVDVSEYQPTTIDFEDLKANGVKAVIVRLGHGTTQDKNAASHLARAKQAGLLVHGYHYYEGVDGEVAWSIKNAQELGLSSGSYYFLDMEGKTAGSWPDIFRGFYRNWLQAGYRTGLYCSLSKYSLFSNKELTSNKVYRWIADWDVDQAPAADIWQFNCSTGLGQYQDKLDKDVDLTGLLVEQQEHPSTVTDPDVDYPIKPGAFVGFDFSTTSLSGGKMLVASPDGINKIPKLDPKGNFLFNNHDFTMIWDSIKPRTVTTSLHWADILDKPDLITKQQLDDRLTAFTPAVSWDQVAGKPDLATQDDLKKIELTPGPPGKDGSPGSDGKPGSNGSDGVSPHIDSATGHWFIGSTDTGVSARGPQGQQGSPGKDGQTPDVSNLATKTDLVNYYTKTETDTKLSTKADQAEYQTLNDEVQDSGGGVNLATETGNVSYSGTNGFGNIGDISVDTLKELRGKYMTISVDVEWNGWKSDGKFPQNRLGWEIQLNYKDGSVDYDGAWLSPTTANGKQRIYGTYMVTDKEAPSLYEGDAYIQISCTSAKISHLKIERGSVATPWTPAPEDTMTAIQKNTTAIGQANQQITDLQTAVKAQQSAAIDTSNVNTSKKPSDYSEGIFHEVKDVSTLGIVRTPADFAPEGRQGTTAFVTTMSYGGMAHQTVDIVDSEKSMRFCRNGKGNTWYRWEWSTTD